MTIRIETPSGGIEAEKAESFLEKWRGLRFRRKGKMLFKFPREVNYSVDMMFVPEKLYLYFLNTEKEVIKTVEAQPLSLNPETWQLHSPQQSYRYLLESFQDLELEQGDRLSF
ncbi:MAG: DUF192 domain-containing protein [Candidatus Nanohaloarchaea archaeon]